MDSVYILAFLTFALVVAFAVWNRMSVSRVQKHGGHASGIGGVNDPLSGATDLPPSPTIPAEKKG